MGSALTALDLDEIHKKNVLTELEASVYIAMSVSFLRKSRMDGDLAHRTPGLLWVKVGRSVGYLRADLDAWLAAYRVERKAV